MEGMEMTLRDKQQEKVSGTKSAGKSVLSNRQKVVKEIFESEQTYISQLHTIVNLFLKPLREDNPGLISAHDVSIIFHNIEDILAVNTELFNFMQQQTLGEAFSYLGPFLKIYGTYASNFGLGNETLERLLKENNQFKNFIEMQESQPECNNLNLPSLLITPVQRIPRYRLLLTELLKYTKRTHIEYLKINNATQQIASVASYINEFIRKHDNAQKMLKIQSSLSGKFMPGIVVPGRTFIKEGKLMKVCRRRPKERMVFLFSDIFIYAKNSILDVHSE
jgi:hypothetical protein